MFFSDLFLGFHLTIYWVYGSLVIATILGMLLIKGINMKSFLISSLSASSSFFLITNFGVWLTSAYYPKTMDGLLICYTMALPFFGNTLLGTFLYTGLLFMVYKLIRNSSLITISDSI